MIKKMLAMLVAISCAFGAWADTHLSGTDFSTHPTGDFITGRDDSGAATESTYWYNGNTNDFSGTIVLGTNGTDHVLDFESNITNPVYRTIEGCYGRTVANFVPHAVGSGLFVDTYVAFTPYLVNNDHAAPTKVTNEDKIVIWVRETEVEEGANITNLIVTAGYIGYGNQVSISNYVADLSSAEVSALCNGQHRLTIKAIQDITTRTDRFLMGFVVYIDGDIYGEPLEYTADAFSSESDVPLTTLAAKYYSTGAHRLFPSLTGVKTSLDSSALSSVGYAGVGQIGSVYFDSYDTSYPAFAGDNLEFNVAFGADVVSFDYAGRTYFSPTNFSVTITTPSVTISNVVYATGWKHKSGTWYNGSTVVSNQYDSVADSDYGTFVFANGTELTLAGFQANYVVGTEEFSTLFGGTTTEAEGAIAYAKRTGDPLKLIKNTTIAEGDDPEHLNRYIYVGQDEALIIDLNGFTLQGTDSDHATIVNVSGTLEVLDSSIAKTGKVLNSGSDVCLELAGDSDTQLSDGTFEIIYVDDTDGAPALTINSGVYFDESSSGPGSDFYLQDCIAEGKSVIDWTEETEGWYATVGEPSGDRWDITFSTNNVVVTEWNLTVNDGDPIGNHIPNFTGGSWDAPAPTAETVVNSNTNFNYTIAVQLSYFPQSPIEEQWADRDGTAAKPFVVRNLADFAGLKSDIAEGYNADKYFEVVVDNITLTDWVGIGTSSSVAFAGKLNGNGNTVNVTFAENKKYNGLFCFVNNATISNLTVNVTAGTISGETAGAAFVGKAYGSCTFETLKATGSLGTALAPVSHNAGGICAQVNGSGTMNFNYCTNAMNIYASYKKVGGILATREVYDTAPINFNNCVNTGNITNSYGVHADCNGTGGLMGWTGYANPASITIANCSNTGNIASPDMYPGNYVGFASAAPTASGVNVGLASLKPTGNGADATSSISGLNWATVSGDIATFVTPVTTVDSVVSYKVMQAASTPNFTLAAAAASLTIDTSLAAYTGTVSVDESLAEDYNLRETAIANGTIYSLESKTPADPWAPSAETDEAASNKVVEIFGDGSDVANHVTTLAQYEALVTYIKSVTSQSEVPTDLTADQKTWMWKSYILGANPLFDEEPAVQITSLTANATAGKWDFTVKVTEGESTDAYNVAADKVGALVKISTSLSTGTWVAPTAGNIEADKLLGGNLIKVTVNFGDGTSGFMKVSE